MTKKFKWLTLSLLATGTLFASGCLGAFWQGLWNTGFPANNRWINLGLDILNEDLFG